LGAILNVIGVQGVWFWI